MRARTSAVAAGALVALSLSPLAAPAAQGATAPVGNDFVVTAGDLSFILKQIKIAERHSATQTPSNLCGTLVGPNPDQIPDRLASYGLRTVDGSCNNLYPGREHFAAADQPFPRLATARFRDAEPITASFPVGPPGPTSYRQKTGNVVDSQPRVVSNLIVDQTSTNPAAIAAAGAPVRSQQNPGLHPCTTDPDPVNNVDAAPAGCVPSHQTLFIPNVTTDVGLSPPYNSMFTFFGQFFDHGVDQTVKSGGTVFVPLQADDPLLLVGPDGKAGSGDEVPPSQAFMVLTRAQNQPGDDGVLGTNDDVQDADNTDSPWVDQSQTYTSHSSHQVFLRDYAMVGGKPVSTGKFMDGIVDDDALPCAPATICYNDGQATDGSISTWAAVKKQAAQKLGLLLTDRDVTNIPMLAADPYGNFLPGPARGLPQYVTASGLVEGDLANPVPVPADVTYFDTPFLTDIAHNADPSPQDTDHDPATPLAAPLPDDDSVASADFAHQPAGTYDDEMLNDHFACGDGRCNENIALSTIHQVFHSEHNRLVDDITATLNKPENAALLASYQAAHPFGTPTTDISYGFGGRLFQAARFVTEMEYQHLVFEEFGRKLVPAIRPFHIYSPDMNPAIDAEFAHAVYRFGHSMLDDDVARISTKADGTKVDNNLSLLDAFLNPPEYFDNRVDSAHKTYTPAEAAGAIVMGSSDQTGNELDEFVTETLRNNLLGLPLDLPTINMTRARDAGVPRLNEFRRDVFAQTNDGQLAPYTSWQDFGQHLKHPESLINFVAAYGLHPSITGAMTLKGKRDAARAIVDPLPTDVQPTDAADFMFSNGTWGNGADGTTTTGVDDIDLWVGGLAEVTNLFGGLLGSTFNYVFQTQMEKLQDGDRLYYLARTPGMNLRTQLEGNSFSEMIQRNTEGTNTLKADVFATADCKFQMANITAYSGLPTTSAPLAPLTGVGAVNDDPTTPDCDENQLLVRSPDGTIAYRQRNSIDPTGINGQAVYNGTAGVDRIKGGNDNDTFWGGEGGDVIDGQGGDDIALGGHGNDILTDLDGADVPKGGPGNDAIDSGPGDDIPMGNAGQDFINGGANDNETFAGPGDDFVIAGQGADAVFGDDGDDWIQGGTGQDLLQGDHGAPFFDDPAEDKPGNDVFVGQNGENDYDAEGGDDIMSQNAFVDRNAGSGGFDWATHQYDTVPAADDMMINNNLGGLPIQVIVLRDRWQETEADSGGPLDDSIKGTGGVLAVPRLISGGGFTGCDAIDQAGMARINGLSAILPPVAQWPGASADVAALSASGSCPLTGPVWGEGDILIGGGGSDTLEGRAGDDIIDGDRALTVRIAVLDGGGAEIGSTDLMENKAVTGSFGPGTTGMTLQQAVFAGLVDPGNLRATRDITVAGAQPTAVDTAVFSGTSTSYNINTVGGVTTVADPTGTDGTDTVRNVELLKFADTTIDLRATAPAAPTGVTAALGAAAGSVDVSWTVPTNTGGSPITAYRVAAYTSPRAAGAAPVRLQTGLLPTARSFTFTGMAPGAYVFTVTAENAKGIGAESDASAALTVPSLVPGLAASTPANGATNVTVTDNITATFSVNVVGVSNTTFQIRRTGGGGALAAAPVTYVAATRIATLNPTANLLPGTSYTVTLTGGAAAIRNAATGTPMATTTWSFTTDGTPPTVLAGGATSPVAGATGVLRTANVVTEFSEQVTVPAGQVTLRRGTPANPVGGAITVALTTAVVNGHTVLTVDPGVTLLANTTYTLRLSQNGTIRDLSGNSLATISRSFTTGAG